MNPSLAPVALFAYNRPQHLKRTLESLALNELASETEVYVFSDGPRKHADEECVKEVRELIKQSFPFKKLTSVERSTNLGLAQSIISGVSEIVKKYGKIIVLEDDMVSSTLFLRYMNESLNKYDGGQVQSMQEHQTNL